MWAKINSIEPIVFLPFFFALASTLLVATNPDYTFPLLPELSLIASVSFCFLVNFRKRTKASLSLEYSEILILFLLVFNVFVLMLPRMLLHIFANPGQQWIPCMSAGKSFYSIECFAQSAIVGHYGVRTFYMLATASVIGIFSFFLTRGTEYFWKFIFSTILVLGLIVAIAGLVCKILNLTQILPTWVMATNFSDGRMTSIFSNPGWVWPYLFPSLSISLWGILYANQLRNRIVCFASFLVISLCCVYTLQRGALLLVVLINLLGAIGFSKKYLYKKKPLFIASIVFLLVILGCFFSFQDQFDQLLMYSLQTKKSMVSSSPERLSLWDAAWNLYKMRPIAGYGYASWFSIISTYQKKSPNVLVFDTAHNLFVQMFVELGAVHSCLILFLVFCSGLLILRRSRVLKGRRFLGATIVVGGLVSALVQEIDYIRPSFYGFSTILGCVLGLRSFDEKKSINWILGDRAIQISKAIASILLIFALGGIIFVGFYFSSHMYPFDGYLTEKTGYLERWGNASVILPSFAGADHKYYSNFRVRSWKSPQQVYMPETEILISTQANVDFNLPLQNGSRFVPKRHKINSIAQQDFSRMLGIRYVYPPFQANNGFIFSQGMYEWENFDGNAGRWCAKKCVFIAKTCGSGLNFQLRASIPRWATQETEWKVWRIGKNIDLREIDVAMTRTPWQTGKIRFGAHELTSFSSSTGDDGYFIVSLTSAESFIPGDAFPGNPDRRELSVIVQDGQCSL